MAVGITHDATEEVLLPQDYVPYIGAINDVDLGNQLIVARQFIAKSGLDQTTYDVSSITDLNGHNFPFPDLAGKLLNEASAIPLNNIILGGNSAQYLRGDNTLQTLDKIAVGLSNVDNTSDANKPLSNAQILALNNKANLVHTHSIADIIGLLATLSNKADLVGGFIPSSQLPSFVDDVLEFANVSNFPLFGEVSKIYVATTINKSYRWGGSVYVRLDDSIALGITIATAFRGDLGQIAYLHSQIATGNPHGTTKSDIGLLNVDNTSDANKPLSNAQVTALATKEPVITNLPISKGGTNSGSALTNNKLFASVSGAIKEILSYWDNANNFLKIGASTVPIATLDITGSFAISMTTQTANYTISNVDNHINVTNGATTMTITLPNSAAFLNREIAICRGIGSTGAINISSLGGNIEALAGTLGATTSLANIGSFGAKVIFKSNGVSWLRKNNG